MPVKVLGYGRRFNLVMIFLLSFSLAAPVIQGLGYSGPGFFGRFFFTALAVGVYTLIHLFPALALSIPLSLLSLGLLNRFYFPGLLENLHTALLTRHPDSLHWPLLITALIALAFYVLLHKLKKPLLPLLLLGLVSFVPLWYFFVDSAYPAAAAYISAWLLLAGYRNGSGNWSHEASEDSLNLRRGWMNYTTALVFLALLASLIIPKDFDPLPWPALQEWSRARITLLENLRGPENPEPVEVEPEPVYTFSSLSAGRLDGPLLRSETVLLEVQGQGGFYLRGSIYDTYTGTTWINTLSPEALTRFEGPPAALEEQLVRTGFWVKHTNMVTNTVFSLLYPVEITGLPWDLEMDQNTSITVPRNLPLGQEYRVQGFLPGPRLDITALEGIESAPADERFLQLPANLPSRVIEKALEITGRHQGDFLKLKALESYLRSRYTYNTEPPFLPPGTDFVDFFLFQTREGYCISFASAFTVMARAAGIPTRYVTGFLVPRAPSEAGVYEVTSWNAHAWVESYIPGGGWLPFETTPGFYISYFQRSSGEPAQNPAEPLPAPNDIIQPDLDPGLSPLPVPDRGTPIMERPSLQNLARVLGAVLLAAVLALPLLLLGRYMKIRKDLQDLDLQRPGPQAVTYYNLTLVFMERLGLGKEPGETPREYSQRAAPFFLYPRILDFKELSEGINLALYSREGEGDPGLAGQARGFFRDVFDRYLSRVGRMTAFREILIHRRYFSAVKQKT